VWHVLHPTLDAVQVRAVLSDVPRRRETGPGRRRRRRRGGRRRRRRCSDGETVEEQEEEEGAGVTGWKRRSAGSEIGRRSVRYQRRMSLVMKF